MKKIIIILCCIVATYNVIAQEIYTDLIERFNKVDNIFEGKVIKSKSYKTIDNGYIYTSNVIEITKVFKGNLECGTVEFITEGGTVNNEKVEASHALELAEGMEGVFLANNTSKELSAISVYQFSNSEKLDATFELQSYIKYWLDGQDIKASDVFEKFNNLSDLYAYTVNIIQSNYIDCGNSNMLLNNWTNIQQLDSFLPESMPIYKKSDYDNAITYSNYKKINQQNNSSRSNVVLTYTLDNPIITGTNPKYFEFDVNVSHDDNSKFFNNGLIRLQYSNSTFGSNIVANNKISVTRGVVIADTVSYLEPTPADITSNEIAIPLTSYLPTNLYHLTNSGEQVVHIKIQIANCNGSNVAFTNQSIMEMLSFYGNSPLDTFGMSYNSIIATGSLTVPACIPTITSFSPNHVHGGVGDTLKIKGFQFGTLQGNGNISFLNADNGGLNELRTDVGDIKKWSDTLIIMVVPSTDSIKFQTPGTGKIKVNTNNGLTAISNSPLMIDYALNNYPDDITQTPMKKYVQYLAKRNSNGGYRFYTDTSISNYPKLLACIKKGIEDWACATKVKFEWVGDTVTQGNSALEDNINIIKRGVLPYNVVARTTSFTGFCSPNLFFTKEIDIIINDSIFKANGLYFDETGSDNIPMDKHDFYYVILHELGHAGGQKHVINQNELMHFEAKTPLSNILPANQRGVTLLLYNEAVAGGSKMVQLSSNASNVNGCNASVTPLIPFVGNLNCLINNINTITEDQIDLYPNPFSDIIDIHVAKSLFLNPFNINLMSISGNMVYSMTVSKIEESYSIKIPQNIEDGIYLLVLTDGQKILRKLIVKANEK